jgi:hypothetical protein
LSKASTRLWANKKYRNILITRRRNRKIEKSQIEKFKKSFKLWWANPKNHKMMCVIRKKSYKSNPSIRHKQSRTHKNLYASNPKKQQKLSRVFRIKWADQTFKQDRIKKMVRGDKHPNWNGGSSFEPYPFGWTHQYRETIRERDKLCCQFCGKTQDSNGQLLDVHHIDYNKKNLDRSNLISLCKSHHRATVTHRDYWQKLLEKLMKKKEKKYVNLRKSLAHIPI